jgi:hypothetical protein
MTAENGAPASGKSKCLATFDANGVWTDSKVNAPPKVSNNWGNSAGFHAARQDAQLPQLTVHWLSVTRATEGPLFEISGPYFDLREDVGNVESLGRPRPKGVLLASTPGVVGIKIAKYPHLGVGRSVICMLPSRGESHFDPGGREI